MAFLPPNLKIMFNPRPAPPFLPPPPPANLPPYTGLMSYLDAFTDPSIEEPFKREYIENLQEKREKKRKLKIAENEEKTAKLLKAWDPYTNTDKTGDPYKTIFVSRISYQTTQQKLEYEFKQFGPIKSIYLVKDTNDSEKHRGYAFIEFERERDMKAAYKQADGMKIDDKRIVVDIERGRVIKNWKPRKFGGGLGNTRAGGVDVNQTFSGRELSESREKEKEREKEREKEKERLEKLKKKDGSSSSSSTAISSGGDRERSDRERSSRSDRERDGGRSDRGDRESRGGDREGRGDRERDRGDRERDRGDRERSDRERDGRSSRSDRSDRESRGGDRESRGDREHHRSSDRGDRERSDRERDRSDREHHRSSNGGGDERRRDQRDYGSISGEPQFDQQFQYPPQNHHHHHQPHPERANRDYSMISNENAY